ncbi:MAG: Stp1/IreP family PP2C-type Ser/Thr phosphatase [Clostridiales bacterium]|nr:Stp1/IreP family PP2C-type Ser/Thr phosphatase [Clostridiales bacterium]
MEAYAQTDVGKKRLINQDYTFYSILPVGKLLNLFIVADGMGGHNAGEYASWYTVETLVQLIRESKEESIYQILNKSIQEVNRRLRRKSYEQERLRGMGTTLTLATIEDHTLYVVNVGDSRTYLIKEDEIRQVSRDHSFVEEMVREGVLERGSRQYQLKKNIITKAIGAELAVKPDFFEVELKENEHLLLCSDGLTNMVEDAEIWEVVKQPISIEQRVHQLIEMANTNGGKDNIAVVLADLD